MTDYIKDGSKLIEQFNISPIFRKGSFSSFANELDKVAKTYKKLDYKQQEALCYELGGFMYSNKIRSILEYWNYDYR